jgi:hypothetical protein
LIVIRFSRKFRFCLPPLLVTLVLGAVLPAISGAQQPAPPPPRSPSEPASPAQSAAPSDNSKPQQGQHGKVLPFLILGTVFTEKGYAFPGVQVRIRRKGEKKFRFETYTSSRGEFAMRVPDGIEYEVVVKEKKYKELTQEVAANMQDVQKRLTFKMELAGPSK